MVLGALQKTSHLSHYTLDQALAVLDKLRPNTAYLTHMSHKMGKHADVEAELPPHVFLAYDGLKVQL